jgi:hypothetical protein
MTSSNLLDVIGSVASSGAAREGAVGALGRFSKCPTYGTTFTGGGHIRYTDIRDIRVQPTLNKSSQTPCPTFFRIRNRPTDTDPDTRGTSHSQRQRNCELSRERESSRQGLSRHGLGLFFTFWLTVIVIAASAD